MSPEPLQTREVSVPELNRLAHELRVACMRIARRARYESGGLAPHLFTVLAPIEAEPRTSSWLAAREQVSMASMSRTVKELEQLGLITRTDHPTDGRQRLLQLTDRGRQELDQARALRTSWMAQRLEQLDAEELAVLKRASSILTRLTEPDTHPHDAERPAPEQGRG